MISTIGNHSSVKVRKVLYFDLRFLSISVHKRLCERLLYEPYLGKSVFGGIQNKSVIKDNHG